MVRRIDLRADFDAVNKTVQITMRVTNNGTEVSVIRYFFMQSEFSAALDEYTPNIGILHCGSNTIQISNADYDEFYQNGADRTDAYTLAITIVSQIIAIE